MSADALHDAAGLGFLGHLVGRTQQRATQSPLPILERRRPGIFEPRAHAAATSHDLFETVDAAGVLATSSLRPPTTPAVQPIAPTTHRAMPAASLPAMTTALDRIRPATPAPVAAAAAEPRIDAASVAARSARSKIAREAAAGRAAAPASTPSVAAVSATSPLPKMAASPPPIATPPPTMAAPSPMSAASMRGTQIVRVEPTRLELRTTVVERDIDRRRDVSSTVPATPAATLKAPPRMAHSEASKAPVAHPARSAAMQAMPAPAAPAPVQVSIGRVEIRGFAGAAVPTPARSAASKPQLGLDEYLQQRHGNGR